MVLLISFDEAAGTIATASHVRPTFGFH